MATGTVKVGDSRRGMLLEKYTEDGDGSGHDCRESHQNGDNDGGSR